MGRGRASADRGRASADHGRPPMVRMRLTRTGFHRYNSGLSYVIMRATRAERRAIIQRRARRRQGKPITMGNAAPDSDPIAVFKADLQALPIRDVVRKHISTGSPFAFSENEYYELRRTVAAEFRLHPTSVVVVGSTRVGFSLNPEHRYRPVQTSSDIDVAIVSQERFDDYWERVFQYAQENLAWRGGRFKTNLFRGWIDPRFLPNTPLFEAAETWVRFFDGLMRSRKYGRRRITARLYRSWDRLEAYQEPSVLACKLSPGST